MKFRFKWLGTLLMAAALCGSLCGALGGCDTAGDKHEHWVEDWETEKEPTCTETGLATGECAGCGEKMTRTLDKLPHSVSATVVAATCEKAGHTRYTCDCGATYDGESTPPTGHHYTKSVVAATCSAAGYTRYACACGDTYDGELTSPTGHRYATTVVEPTCSAAGYTRYACACGDTYDGDFIPPTGHTLVETVTLPTCEEEGFTHFACEACDYEYDGDFVIPLGHSLIETVVPATCVDDGYTHFGCEACDYQYVGYPVPALGESHVNLTVEIVYPTINRPEGYARYHCPDCGHSYEKLMNYSDIITGAYVDTTEILKQGIDTSKWNHVGYQPDGQLNPLDWEALKAAGVEFVILKAGSTYGIDETFERDYLEAKAAGLEVGAYFYAYATTPEETLADVEMLLSWLEGKQFDLPIYLDFEDPSLVSLGKETLTELCRLFVEKLQEEGYYAALYVNTEWLYTLLDTEWVKANLDVWYARYTADDYSDPENHYTLADTDIPWKDGYTTLPGETDKRYGIWQYTCIGKIEGFTVNFDFNFAFKDYRSIMEQWGLNGF